MPVYQVVRDMPIDAAGPATCYFCKAAHRKNDDGTWREQLLVTDTYIDFEGRLVICESCVNEITATLGGSSKGDLANLKAHRDDLLTAVDALHVALEEAQDERAALAAAIHLAAEHQPTFTPAVKKAPVEKKAAQSAA